MKKITVLFLLLTGIIIFGQGIKFENESFKNLLDKAKKENKLIFMDAYASWCGPCKKMDKEVFTQQEVGDLFNSSFINTKFDMEKGEGLEIAKKYGVRAFPTYLFIDGNGEVVYRGTGYYETPEFIKIAKNSMDPAQKLSYMQEKFNSGATDPSLLKNIMKAFAFSNPELANKAAEKYFDAKKGQPLANEDLESLFTFTKSAKSPLYKVMVDRKAEIVKLMPNEQYTAMLKNYQLNTIMENAYNKETKQIDEKKFSAEAEKFMTKEDAKNTLLQIKMRMALRAKKFAEYEKLALDYYKDGENSKFSANELNEVSWNFFENVSNKESLSKAVLWATQSVKKGENYANCDTLANLYMKVEDKASAKYWATRAIELGEKADEDVETTKELLKKL